MNRRLLVLFFVLVCGAAVIRSASTVEAVPIRRPLVELPLSLGSWRSIGDERLDRGTLDVLRADDYVSRTYVSGATQANLFVAYYMTQRQGDTMHSPMNCLPGSGWQPLSIGRTQIPIGGGVSVDSNRYVIQKGLDQQLVLYWFQSHGRTIASEYASKVYLVLDSLRLRRSDAALVRVVVPIAGEPSAAEGAAVAFVRRLYPALDAHIPA